MVTVMDHHSKRSVDDHVPAFQKMFPDSEIAQKMSLGRTKVSYVIYHGLAFYFENELNRELDVCKYFVVSFDEAMNRIVQKGQMDIHIRYF